LYDWACLCQKKDQAKLDQYVQDTFGDEAGLKGRLQELERLLEEQIAAVKAAFADEMKAQERKDAIARDSCLAPKDETANMVLRLEMTLDRAIDRKVRILLAMRKEHARQEKETASRPEEQPEDRAAEELSKLVGLDDTTRSPAEKNAAEASKSPEQSENVIENKGPATAGSTPEALRTSGKELPTGIVGPQQEGPTRVPASE
jgi:hypothetical protein